MRLKDPNEFKDNKGQEIDKTYIKNLSASGNTITYTKGDGSTGTITTQDTDTKVTNTLATTTKAYITGTTSASTNTGTQIFDTGVYLDTTAGTLTATTFKGTLSGNASTATTLQTARTINGTSFNGGANITTANWGTARNITIGNTTKSVNGSGNVSWSWSEMQVPRAYSSSYNFGGNQNAITTAQFITMLTNLGAFSQPYWVSRGSWSYASNQYINDTGCGNIHLAGCVVEVMGTTTAYTIRVTTPTTTASGTTNAEFIYVNNGADYSPGWRRQYNTKNKPTPSEIGAAASSHTHNYAGSSSAGGAATTALACTGNSATATKLQTARTINGVSFDGSQNITVADSTKLPLSGGTMTGSLKMSSGIYTGNDKYIYGTNTSGGTFSILGTTSSNNVVVGPTSHNLVLRSSTNPRVLLGSSYYDLYHTGNKPTPSDIGANNTSEGFYVPPTIPSCVINTSGLPANYSNPTAHLDAILGGVLSTNSGYIKRTTLGKDQSGTYDVFKYELTPKNYVKTIMIVGGVHGNERSSMYGVCHFLRLLADKNENNPMLNYIRENVRVVSIPLVNPWGFANSKRQNSRGVDLNRNHDYNWHDYNTSSSGAGQTNYKGSAPCSEKESQYIVQVADSVSRDLVGYLDCHNIISIDANHIYYAPRHQNQRNDLIASVIHHLKKDKETVIWGTGKSPTSYSYICDKYGITGGTPEWRDGLRGGTLSSQEMTKIVEWFANLAIKFATIKTKTSAEFIDDNFAKVLTYRYTQGNNKLYLTNGSSNVNVRNTSYSFPVKRHGIVRVDGHIKVSLSEESTVDVIPCLYQNYQIGLNFGNMKDNEMFKISQKLPAGTHVIPLHAMAYVFPTCYSTTEIQRCGDVEFRIRGKISGSSGYCYIQSMCVSVQYTPSNMGISVELLDSTGKESITSDYFTRVFPTSEYGGEAEND